MSDFDNGINAAFKSVLRETCNMQVKLQEMYDAATGMVGSLRSQIEYLQHQNNRLVEEITMLRAER